MKRTSLITDFICYLAIFLIVFTIGAYIIAKEVRYNRELLVIDNAQNKEASGYAKSFVTNQEEYTDLLFKKQELEAKLREATLLTDSKLKDSANQSTELENLSSEISTLSATINDSTTKLSSLTSEIKSLNEQYIAKNNIYIELLKKKANV